MMFNVVLALLSLFMPPALARKAPRSASSEPSERSVPTSDVALVAVINQALPTAAPADPATAFVCVATWTLRLNTDDDVSLAPGCPMADEVHRAAAQWRFGLRGVPRDTEVVTVHARLAYGPDKNGEVGWFYLMGPGTTASFEPREVDKPRTSGPKPKVKVTPRFPETAKRDNVASAECNARFTIDEEGVVTEVETFGCREDFQIETLDAASKWRFEPVVVDGVPKGATFTLKVKFLLK